MKDEIFSDTHLQHRKIPIFNDISKGTQKRLTDLIHFLDSVSIELPITILIDSSGGNITHAMMIVDAIEQAKAETKGLVVGEASSAAFRVLQACDKRAAYPNARLMFHGYRPGRPLRYDEDEDESSIQRKNKEWHDEQLDVLKKRSGQNLNKLKKWRKEERVFFPEEALELGFIDEIYNKPDW